MTMSGMDATVIRQVAGQLSQQSESIAETSRRVDSLLDLVRHHWQGEDVRQFDSRWMDQYRGICLRLHDNLADLARIARDNADAQEKTSATLDGGGGPGGSLSAHPGSSGSAPSGGTANLDWGSFYNAVAGVGGTLNKVVEGKADLDSPLLSSIAYLPDAFNAFKDAASGNLDVAGFTGFMGSTLQLGGTFMDTFGSTLDGAAMGKALGTVGGVIGAGMDFDKAYQDYSSGNPWAGTYDVVHGGVAAVGVAIPPVGWCLDAWDGGVAIGTAIADSPPFQQAQDSAVAYGAAHDSDIGTRYDIGSRGVDAVGNFFSDSWHGLFG
jgi:uncharacterized protein YukE